jgi:EAL domain-containing protein (putative c-di-GMP-specific phosphodiesterase class I)
LKPKRSEWLQKAGVEIVQGFVWSRHAAGGFEARYFSMQTMLKMLKCCWLVRVSSKFLTSLFQI